MHAKDLLKCIHHFASTYYSEMGQLRDSSKEYRREKKLRRLKRLEQQAAKRASDSANCNLPDDEGTSETNSSKDSSEEESVAEKSGKLRKPRNTRRHRPQVDRDMYKVFDGSALMAIGMVFYVTQLACPHDAHSHVTPTSRS